MTVEFTRKHLTLRFSMAGAGLFPMLSFALGLSDIQVDSRLNQPLQARVEVTDVSDEEWPRIHASLNHDSPLDEGAVHLGLLDRLTVRTAGDASHRHFIVLQSAEPLTEPMFDLSVEVSGSTTHLIRSYTVLLDPPRADDDAPRRLVESQRPGAPDVSGESAQPSNIAQAQPVPTLEAATASSSPQLSKQDSKLGSQQRPPAKQSRSRGARGEARAGGSASPLPAHVYVVNKSDTLERIARHLGAHGAAERRPLMQWIFEHNPQAFYGDMHHLHAKARLTLPENTPTAAATTSQPVQNPPSEDTHEELVKRLEALQESLKTVQERLSAQNAQIAILTAQIAARAHSQAPQSAPESQPSSGDTDEDTAAPGRWERYLRIGGVGLTAILGVGFAAFMWRRRRSGAPSGPSAAPGLVNSEVGKRRASVHSAAERPAVTAADQKSQAIPPAARNDRRSATSTGAPAQTQREGHSVANREAAAILENSLDDAPHRVDIGIKLLEIYHHEVQGNRAEFNAMLSKLVADPQTLTPDQRSHIEKLQNTLSDDESTASAEFVTKVAM